MRVIYIAGTSHSGSTLLDLMLIAHPAIFSPSLWQCPVSSCVDARTRETAGKSLADLDMFDARPTRRKAPNAIVFKAIADVSGKSFVVDSSRMPKRLSYLMRLEELDVYPCISSATRGADQLGGSQARRLPQAHPPL